MERQWRCEACLTLDNVATRKVCRLCRRPASEVADVKALRSQPPAVKPRVENARQGRPTTAGSEVVANARKLGVSPETVAQLEKDLAQKRERTQSTGTRLNVAEGKLQYARASATRLRTQVPA